MMATKRVFRSILFLVMSLSVVSCASEEYLDLYDYVNGETGANIGRLVFKNTTYSLTEANSVGSGNNIQFTGRIGTTKISLEMAGISPALSVGEIYFTSSTYIYITDEDGNETEYPITGGSMVILSLTSTSISATFDFTTQDGSAVGNYNGSYVVS